MSLKIQPSRVSRIRAAAQAHPELDMQELARLLDVLASDVRTALSRDPKPRTGRRAVAR